MSSPRILSEIKKQSDSPLTESNLTNSLLKQIDPALLKQLDIPETKQNDCKGLASMYLTCALRFSGIIKASSVELILFTRYLNTYFQGLGEEDASKLLSEINKIIKELINEALENKAETAPGKIEAYQNFLTSLPNVLEDVISNNKFPCSSSILSIKNGSIATTEQLLTRCFAAFSFSSQNDSPPKTSDKQASDLNFTR